MQVYTVHAPLDGAASRIPGDGFEFVRDGFHFWAFAAGVLWLLYHRLWLATLGYLGMAIVIGISLLALRADSYTALWVFLTVAMLMGFEASSLRRWTLSRRRWRQLDVVVAADEQAAERRFFDRWTAGHGAPGDDQPAVDRGGPPPTREIPGQPFSRPPTPGILGLFPQPWSPT